MEIELRNFQTTKRSFFLFGPRGTGKSTLVKQRYPDAKIIDLLDPEHYRLYRAYPERFSQFVQAHPKTSCFVIDEIQKIPELLSVVHQLIEMNSHWQFILISSNFRPLRQRGVDLLAGRAQLRSLHPFMASEIPERFDLAQHLRIGMLPLIVNSSDPKNDLKAYISLYSKEEVQLEGLIRKIEDFHQFLEIISLSQASVIY